MSWRKVLGVSPTQNTHNSQIEGISSNFVNCAYFAEDYSKLVERLTQACCNLPTNVEQVLSSLLSNEDEKDIIKGLIPVETLRLHIELWVKHNMPYYSGKPVKANGLEEL